MLLNIISEGDKVSTRDIVGSMSGNNIFDIVPPNTGKIPGAACYRCIHFVKEGDCKQKKLSKKLSIRACGCDKFFNKSSVQTGVQ